jgi:hypothetical protein
MRQQLPLGMISRAASPPLVLWLLLHLMIAELPAWQAPTSDPDPMTADAAQRLMLLNDLRIDGRLLAIERTSTMANPDPGLWSFPDLRAAMAKLPPNPVPIPKTITYTMREEYAIRGLEIACRKSPVSDDIPAGAGIELTPEHSVQTVFGEHRALGTGKSFSLQPPTNLPAGVGLATLGWAETSFALGVGYGQRIQTITSLERLSTGRYRIQGTLEYASGLLGTFDAEFDRRMIARESVIRYPAGNGRTNELKITTQGEARTPDEIAMAATGLLDRAVLDGPVEAEPTDPSVPANPRAGHNRQTTTIRFASLSSNEADEHGELFTIEQPSVDTANDQP